MPVIPIQYVNCAGALGMVAFGILSYQWIERKRNQGPPLPPWFKEYLKEVKRQRGELEEEQETALSPADGIAGLVREAFFALKRSLCRLKRIKGLSLECQYGGDVNDTMKCELNCTYNGTLIYQGPCHLAVNKLRLNMTFPKRRRVWHSMILNIGLQYYVGGRIMYRLYMLSNLSTSFTGMLQCICNDSSRNVTQGKIVLQSQAWGQHVLSATSADRRNTNCKWQQGNSTEAENSTVKGYVSTWLERHLDTDRYFLSDVCIRLIYRLKKFEASPVNITDQDYADNTTYGVLEWPTWTQVMQLWSSRVVSSKLTLCAWGLFSISSVALGAFILVALFAGFLGRSQRHIRADIQEMHAARREIRAAQKSKLFYINESADFCD
ncbi:Rh66/Rh62 [macacine betaherpesvirus 3]|nr:Rh66/Rh62 [macacine betaherpesvirus 3]